MVPSLHLAVGAPEADAVELDVLGLAAADELVLAAGAAAAAGAGAAVEVGAGAGAGVAVAAGVLAGAVAADLLLLFLALVAGVPAPPELLDAEALPPLAVADPVDFLTPPWWLQAPLPVLVEVVPSPQVTAVPPSAACTDQLKAGEMARLISRMQMRFIGPSIIRYNREAVGSEHLLPRGRCRISG